MVLPFNGRDLFDAFFLKRFAAVVAVQDYGCPGCFVAICSRIVEDPLDLDWRKLSADFKGFSIGVDGLLTFGGSGVDGWVPGQVFDFYSRSRNLNSTNSKSKT